MANKQDYKSFTSVSCPSCEAAPGEKCTNINRGFNRYRKCGVYTHITRVNKYRRVAAQPQKETGDAEVRK